MSSCHSTTFAKNRVSDSGKIGTDIDRIGDKVQILGPDGKLLAATDVKQNAKVHVRLIQDGDRTVVDKIYVE